MGEISLELIYKRLEELQAGQDGIRAELVTLNDTVRSLAKSSVSMQREISRLNDRVTVLTVAVDDHPRPMSENNTRPPPCPFCGKLSWRFFRDPGTWATAIECTHCGARGPLCIPDEGEALAAWSERPPLDPYLVPTDAK